MSSAPALFRLLERWRARCSFERRFAAPADGNRRAAPVPASGTGGVHCPGLPAACRRWFETRDRSLPNDHPPEMGCRVTREIHGLGTTSALNRELNRCYCMNTGKFIFECGPTGSGETRWTPRLGRFTPAAPGARTSFAQCFPRPGFGGTVGRTFPRTPGTGLQTNPSFPRSTSAAAPRFGATPLRSENHAPACAAPASR